MVRKRSSEAEALWRERLARFQRGDLKVGAFCRREGVSEPSLYRWRNRLLVGMVAFFGNASRKASKEPKQRSDQNGGENKHQQGDEVKNTHEISPISGVDHSVALPRSSVVIDRRQPQIAERHAVFKTGRTVQANGLEHDERARLCGPVDLDRG